MRPLWHPQKFLDPHVPPQPPEHVREFAQFVLIEQAHKDGVGLRGLMRRTIYLGVETWTVESYLVTHRGVTTEVHTFYWRALVPGRRRADDAYLFARVCWFPVAPNLGAQTILGTLFDWDHHDDAALVRMALGLRRS